MTEDRGQRTEDSGQRTEDRGQRTADTGQSTQDDSQEIKKASAPEWRTLLALRDQPSSRTALSGVPVYPPVLM